MSFSQVTASLLGGFLENCKLFALTLLLALPLGPVSYTHLTIMRPAAEVREGDVISLKGSGRITVGAASGISRKGRICLSLYRWK